MMRHWFCVVLVASSAMSTAMSTAPASAQPAKPVDKAKSKTAKQYVDAAIAAQNTGDYDTAITLYQKAYDLVPHPVLIFNIAQATRLAGRVDDALALYNKYLASDPSGAQAQTARELVAEINAKKAEAAKAAETAKAAEAAKQAQPAPAPTPAPAPVLAPASPVAEADHGSPGRGMRLAGITVGAVGVVGVGIGIGFALHGKSLQSDVEKQYDKSKVDAGKQSNTLALVGAIGGGALIATGVTLYVLGHRKDAADHVALAPVVSARSAGLVLSGAW